MSRTAPFEVLYQSDENYAVVLWTSMLSLFESNRDIDYRVSVIDCGLEEDSREKLHDLAEDYGREILFIDAQADFGESIAQAFSHYDNFRANTLSFYKIFYPTLKQCALRVLYLDCDTLLVGSIRELVEFDLGSHPVAMVLDSTIDGVYKELIGLAAEDPYFNSGVMLIDSEEWVNQDIPNRILQQAQSGVVYNTVDQDYINMAVLGNCAVLDARYNLQPFHLYYKSYDYLSVYQKDSRYYTAEELDSANAEPSILHVFRYLYCHPWDKGSLHPAEGTYQSYYLRNPWGLLPQKKRLSAVFAVERGLYRVLPKLWFLKLFKRMHDHMLKQ